MGMAAHHRTRGQKDEWLTPPDILKQLGPFDLDPCAPIRRPWPMARKHYTIKDDGLKRQWRGHVWLNPPYGPPAVVRPWMKKMAEHDDGIALIFARTETDMFHEFVWDRARALFFFYGRLKFYNIHGVIPVKEKTGRPGNAGAPSVLVAYGPEAVRRLRKFKYLGHYLEL